MDKQSPHLPKEEHEVSYSVDCGDTQSVFHQDHKGVACRRAETGAVDRCGCICILGNKNPGERSESVTLKSDELVGSYLIEIVEALLQTPQTTDARLQQTASADVLLKRHMKQSDQSESQSAFEQFGGSKVDLYLSFQLVVDVHEDESRDLDQRDDEGSFSDGAQVVPDQPHDRRQDRSHRETVLVPVT